MSLKHVNAVVVGGGAGGGIVAKELAEAGLSVVLLERGKWYTSFDDRKDDLRNQRTCVLGNAFGPDEQRNPRVSVDARGQEHIVRSNQGAYSNNAACVGGGTLSYGAMAWRFLEKDFRLRSTYGSRRRQHARRLAHQLLRPRALLRKSRVGDRRFGRRLEQHLPRPAPPPSAHASAASEPRTPDSEACRRAPGPAPVRPSHAAQFRSLQRTRRLHALPLVRGLCLRSRRQVRHAEHGHPQGAPDGQLRTAHANASRRKFSPTTAAAPPASPISIPTAACRNRPPIWWWSPAAATESARLLLNSKSRLFPNGLGQPLRLGGTQPAGPRLHRRRRAVRAGDLRRPRPRRFHRALRLQPRQSGIRRRRPAGQRVHPPAVSVRSACGAPGVPRWGAAHKDFMRRYYRRSISVMGPVQEMPVFEVASASRSRA